jgi:hypothetical protein
MINNAPTYNEDIRAMRIIFYAILAGQIIFGAIVFYLVYTGMLKNDTCEQ